jgi:hypothetical protein
MLSPSLALALGLAGSQTIAPPVNSVLPVISGNPQVGSTLTTTTGTWSGSPTFTFQWLSGGSPISGATSQTFVPTSAQIGDLISVTVTATNGGGSVPATSSTVGPVTASGFTPMPRSKTVMLQQRSNSIGLTPTQPQGTRVTIPLILTSVLGGSSHFGTVATADLTMEDTEGVINNIQTMFVDASAMAFPIRLYFLETQQTVFIGANTQGYYQIAVGQQVQMTATAFSHSGTDQANVTVSIQFLNMPVSTAVWVADGS